ncbi:hypothetical protein R7007_16710 [Vibrio sp. 1636]|nr:MULTISPECIES: hypothetical protein [Vibrio]MDW2203306.1 hypothetical protein [Vibrio sp. 1636]
MSGKNLKKVAERYGSLEKIGDHFFPKQKSSLNKNAPQKGAHFLLE